MIKKYGFYFSLLIIYLLFLCKDAFYGFMNNLDPLKDMIMNTNETYYQNEYQKLLNILELEEENRDVIFCKVLTREIYEFYDKITISKGINEGILVGDVVINEKGVIGIISKVYQNYSEVSLITNQDLQLSVKINQSYGILFNVDHHLYVKNLKLNEEIKVGDSVYTSGLTNITEGYLIGYVKNVSTDSLELEYILDIEDLKQIQDISYVGVLKS